MRTSLTIFSSTGASWYRSSDQITGEGGAPKPTVRKIVRNRAAANVAAPKMYPLFAAAAEHIADPFWKAILVDLSEGKLRRGYRYYPPHLDGTLTGRLTYKVRNRDYETELGKDPAEVAEQVKNFMIDKGNMLSPIDRQIRERELALSISTSPDIAPQSWGRIRNVTHRAIIIHRFISTVVEAAQLDGAQKKELENLITLGITAHIFNSDTIILKDGFIVNIMGLHYVDGHFVIDPKLVSYQFFKPSKVTHVEEEDDSPMSGVLGDDEMMPSSTYRYQPVNFAKQWLKFLARLDARISRYGVPLNMICMDDT